MIDPQISIVVRPVATVYNDRLEPGDHSWGNVISEIRLLPPIDPVALKGIGDFSHLEILFYFHALDESKVVYGARHPRDIATLPLTGIFAQRGAPRPNRLGATIATFMDAGPDWIRVKGLDAINGTPVIDIKPVIREFLPGTPVKQPSWISDLMQGYW